MKRREIVQALLDCNCSLDHVCDFHSDKWYFTNRPNKPPILRDPYYLIPDGVTPMDTPAWHRAWYDWASARVKELFAHETACWDFWTLLRPVAPVTDTLLRAITENETSHEELLRATGKGTL